jgi:GDP-L-fucose synthase
VNLNRSAYNAENLARCSHINIGTGQDIAIKELVETVQKVVGYKGRFAFDSGMPDSPPQTFVRFPAE